MRNDTQASPTKSGMGCGQAFGIGCLVVVLLLGVGLFGTYRFLRGMAEDFTSTTPQTLPTISATEKQVSEVTDRVNAFREAVVENNDAAPLVLTSKDINSVLQNHPDLKELGKVLYITITDDKVTGQVSIPIGEAMPALKGRYLNGTASFRIAMANGRPAVYIDSLKSADGKTPPEAFLKELRKIDFLDNANTDENVKNLMDKIESISIKNGNLTIAPRQSI